MRHTKKREEEQKKGDGRLNSYMTGVKVSQSGWISPSGVCSGRYGNRPVTLCVYSVCVFDYVCCCCSAVVCEASLSLECHQHFFFLYQQLSSAIFLRSLNQADHDKGSKVKQVLSEVRRRQTVGRLHFARLH